MTGQETSQGAFPRETVEVSSNYFVDLITRKNVDMVKRRGGPQKNMNQLDECMEKLKACDTITSKVGYQLKDRLGGEMRWPFSLALTFVTLESMLIGLTKLFRLHSVEIACQSKLSFKSK